MKPYNDNDPKKQQVETMFNAIAPRYDLLNRLLSLGIDTFWRRALVKKARAQQPPRTLDLACGTGDLTIALAKAMPAKEFLGADLSENMLQVARHKISKQKYKDLNITLQQADAEKLPFPDNHFNAVTCAFGVRNFGDLQQGLREMFRVTTPNGKLYILEFSTPRKSLFAVLFRFYFQHILPLIGRLISKDSSAYTYLPKSVAEFPDGEKFLSLLREAGFTECASRTLTFSIATLYTASKQ